MASKALATITLVISLNLLFFSLVTSHYVPCPPPPHKTPKPHPIKPTPKKASCPKDTLKLSACGDLLNNLVHIVTPAKSKCCSLIEGLNDFDAAVCLCTAIKANVLGTNLNVPVSLTLLLNTCGKTVPSDYQCDAW